MQQHVMLCYVTLRYVTLRYVTLRYVMLCYVMSHCKPCSLYLTVDGKPPTTMEVGFTFHYCGEIVFTPSPSQVALGSLNRDRVVQPRLHFAPPLVIGPDLSRMVPSYHLT